MQHAMHQLNTNPLWIKGYIQSCLNTGKPVDNEGYKPQHMTNEKPWCLGYIADEILRSYVEDPCDWYIYLHLP